MPTTDCNQASFGFHPALPIAVSADAPRTSSDGGLLLLRQADERIGVARWFAEHLSDERAPDRVEHSRIEQVRQRVYQIAMGYEDCNDADHLRHDPLLQTVCDRLPDDRDGLSSQPTLSRFENAVRGGQIRALQRQLEASYVDELPPDTTLVVLDIDSTDDETHGKQQLTFFHGFYDQHMYHPLLVFDGLSGQLVSVLLRPGNAHAAKSARSMLVRIIRRIKARLPNAQVVVRGDSGFAMPALLDALERLDRELGDVDYVIGMAKNPRLLAQAEPAMRNAETTFEATGRHVRHFDSFSYAAQTWTRERHIVAKAEHHDKGRNPRFVVTTLTGFEPRLLYDVAYCARGQCENMIKDLKNALQADRLSCCRFAANAFRLLLHAAAYRLMHALRTAAQRVSPSVAAMQFDTLRLRVLKVAALVRRSARRIAVQLPAVFPQAAAFFGIALALAPAAPS